MVHNASPTASTVLVVAIGIVAAATGLLVLGPAGLVLTVLALGVVMTRRRDLASSRMALRALRARPISRWEAPWLVDTVAWLAHRAGLPRTPTVAIMPAPMMNAVATGTPDDALVAVTPSLLHTLRPREIVGVLAHEISHISSGDMRVLGIGRALAGFTQTLSITATMFLLLFGPAALAAPLSTSALLGILWAPTAASLLLLWLSRMREHAADHAGATLTGDPEGLAHALWMLERSGGAMLGGHAVGATAIPEFLRTHPTTPRRIERLRRLAVGGGTGARDARVGVYGAADDDATTSPAR